MYCIKCGVELADSERVCPLCGTRVFHPDLPCGQGEPPYPPADHPRHEEVSRIGVLFVISVCMLLPAVIVVLAALYPKFGFIVRKVEGDVQQNREQILNAFRSAGFDLVREADEALFFRAKSPLYKLLLLGEDEIKVSQYGQWILIDGIRRGVARVEYRLDSYIRMRQYDN